MNGSETGSSFRQALYFMEVGFKLWDTMIWDKNCVVTPTEGRYYNVIEYMFILSKDTPKTLNFIEDRKNITSGQWAKSIAKIGNEKRDNKVVKNYITKEFGRRYNIWSIKPQNIEMDNHPAIFPESLAADHIISWSSPGDLIFDPFAGSGTVGKTSAILNRRWLGCDCSQEYVDLANRRIANVTREMAGEWKPMVDNSRLDDLPLFGGK